MIQTLKERKKKESPAVFLQCCISVFFFLQNRNLDLIFTRIWFEQSTEAFTNVSIRRQPIYTMYLVSQKFLCINDTGMKEAFQYILSIFCLMHLHNTCPVLPAVQVNGSIWVQNKKEAITLLRECMHDCLTSVYLGTCTVLPGRYLSCQSLWINWHFNCVIFTFVTLYCYLCNYLAFHFGIGDSPVRDRVGQRVTDTNIVCMYWVLAFIFSTKDLQIN